LLALAILDNCLLAFFGPCRSLPPIRRSAQHAATQRSAARPPPPRRVPGVAHVASRVRRIGRVGGVWIAALEMLIRILAEGIEFLRDIWNVIGASSPAATLLPQTTCIRRHEPCKAARAWHAASFGAIDVARSTAGHAPCHAMPCQQGPCRKRLAQRDVAAADLLLLLVLAPISLTLLDNQPSSRTLWAVPSARVSVPSTDHCPFPRFSVPFPRFSVPFPRLSVPLPRV
jgi:hypothetical protein